VAAKNEPRSHFYMCSVEHGGNYRNLLTHPPNYLLCVGLEVLPLMPGLLIPGLFVKTALIKTIIPLSKKLSIVIVRCPRNITGLRSHDTS
jgi:hypothetical protein